MGVFSNGGMKSEVRRLQEEIKELYASDAVPWVVGYSGGKDSTAALQLVWGALSELSNRDRRKPVHVISTDTLVENPVVASWVNRSLERMEEASQEQGLGIRSHRLTPDPRDTFWVNLIGRGYPAPRPKFRWCTERLKISPSNRFIRDVIQESGETILVLGVRKAESAVRAKAMDRQEQRRNRDRLSPNAALPGSLVYTPIEDWSNDEVWLYLMQVRNPWGWDNRDLMSMYRGASEDGECPLVIDTSTPSCGSSRFGCWVCTLVDEDKSMRAMIQNDEEKAWMRPLLELRNELGDTDDRAKRDFRRMGGFLQLYYRKSEKEGEDREAQLIHGPYKQEVRGYWLRRVLSVQRHLEETAPEGLGAIQLISLPELEEIRRIWVLEKHEFEDRLPSLFEETTGRPYPGVPLHTGHAFGIKEIRILRELCGEEELLFQLLRELLDTELRFRTMTRRMGLFDALEGIIKKHFYTDADDALKMARAARERKERAAQGEFVPLLVDEEDDGVAPGAKGAST
ncbi:DNA phosphorothioation system sulfurtransferase DndC [Gemmatimonadota bacterium]